MAGHPNKLVVIGAGLPRTGTLYTKAALEELLGGHCYHMTEFMQQRDKKEAEFWRRALRREVTDPEEWKQFLEGRDYRASVDYPSSFFLKEQMAAFPDAKVLLTVRPPDKWHDSVQGAIMRAQNTMNKFPQSWLGKLVGLGDKMKFANDISTAVPSHSQHSMFSSIKAGYPASEKYFNDWTEEVKRIVPAKQLLVFEVKEGYGPLCAFLGLPEPKDSFPRVNDTAEIKKKLRYAQIGAWIVIVILPLLLVIGAVVGIVVALV